jgi:hypothetical protein
VVVNLSDAPAQARVHVHFGDELRGSRWRLSDTLAGRSFERDGDELADSGLYVGLDAWGSHFLALIAVTADAAAANADAVAV